MRWFLSAAAALFLMWAWYMGSPYLALWSLATAVERGDAATVQQRVNMSALRLSLAQQLAAEELRAAGPQGPRISSADQQLAAAALSILADPIMERLLTSAGTLQLLRNAVEGRDPTTSAPTARGNGIALNRVPEFLGASRWRGFRNVYFAVPPDRPPDQRFRLQMRFSRLAWRLVGLELPPAIRQRFARELAARAQAAE